MAVGGLLISKNRPADFERLDLGDSTVMAGGITEVGRQECLNELPGQGGADDLTTKAEDVHVVIFNSLMGGEHVMNQAGANTGNLVGGDRSANTAAA